MKKGKPSYIKNTASVKSNIKNIININLAEKLAQQVKKKKTKKSRKNIRQKLNLDQNLPDTIELKPRSMMPQGNALTSGSALRISMPNQTFGAIPRMLQPSTYVIPDSRVLGTFQPSSFGVRDQQKTTQSIIEQAVAEAIKKNQPQPAGPNTRVVPSVNPYNPNDALVSDSNAITADDSDKKKAQDFVRELAQAKALSRLEYVSPLRSEGLFKATDEELPIEEQAGFPPIDKKSSQKLTRGVVAFLANYYNLTRSQDLKGYSAEKVLEFENRVKEINPDIIKEAYKIQYGEAGQAPKNVQTVIPLLNQYIKSKASVASSSIASSSKAVIAPDNEPVFSNEQLLANAQQVRSESKDVQKVVEEVLKRSRSRPRESSEQSGASKSREPREFEAPQPPIIRKDIREVFSNPVMISQMRVVQKEEKKPKKKVIDDEYE
jgi:hypothetical protein